MVNPIGANVTASAPSPILVDPERPASLPDASMRVSAVDDADGGGAADHATSSQADARGGSLERTVQELNDTMRAWATGMRFDMDPDAQRMVVSIIDNESGEVIKTVPSDAVIRVAKMIVQLQGKTIDTRV